MRLFATDGLSVNIIDSRMVKRNALLDLCSRGVIATLIEYLRRPVCTGNRLDREILRFVCFFAEIVIGFLSSLVQMAQQATKLRRVFALGIQQANLDKLMPVFGFWHGITHLLEENPWLRGRYRNRPD